MFYVLLISETKSQVTLRIMLNRNNDETSIEIFFFFSIKNKSFNVHKF